MKSTFARTVVLASIVVLPAFSLPSEAKDDPPYTLSRYEVLTATDGYDVNAAVKALSVKVNEARQHGAALVGGVTVVMMSGRTNPVASQAVLMPSGSNGQ